MTQETKPLVTIVTITFNLIKAGRENYFRQCLESVHDQTYGNIEHIVVDGASNDGTVDLIKEYADKGWVKYVSQSDTGIYDAMNKGIKLAKGKYVSFLNSDDYYHDNNGVQASIKALEHSGADFSYAPASMVNEDGSKLSYTHPHCNPKISDVFFVMPFCHQTMFTKREVMMNEGMFDSTFKSAGDYDFVMRLCLKKYKSVFVKHEFVTYRFGGLSDTNQQQSIDEVARSYFKNYGKLYPISSEECGNIYCRGFSGISWRLARKLKKVGSYFDYSAYVGYRRTKFRNKIARLLSSCYLKCKFVLLSPRKFVKKYLLRNKI